MRPDYTQTRVHPLACRVRDELATHFTEIVAACPSLQEFDAGRLMLEGARHWQLRREHGRSILSRPADRSPELWR